MVCGLLACGLDPVTQVSIRIDTDLPVPRLASAMRIDVHSTSGAWIASRTFALLDAADWPATFTIAADDPEKPIDAILRIRVFPEGKVRTYRGERFVSRPDPGDDPAAPFVEVEGNDQPRLIRGGTDGTPADEPLPLVTVDRLL